MNTSAVAKAHNTLVKLEEAIKKTWPQLDPRAGPRQLQAPHTLPYTRNVRSTGLSVLEAAQDTALRQQRGDEIIWAGHRTKSSPSPLCMRLNPTKTSIQTLKILVGGWRKRFILQHLRRALQDFPVLMEAAARQSAAACLPSLPALGSRVSFRFHAGRPWGGFRPTGKPSGVCIVS